MTLSPEHGWQVWPCWMGGGPYILCQDVNTGPTNCYVHISNQIYKCGWRSAFLAFSRFSPFRAQVFSKRQLKASDIGKPVEKATVLGAVDPLDICFHHFHHSHTQKAIRHSVWRKKSWSGGGWNSIFDRFRNIGPSDYRYITVKTRRLSYRPSNIGSGIRPADVCKEKRDWRKDGKCVKKKQKGYSSRMCPEVPGNPLLPNFAHRLTTPTCAQFGDNWFTSF